MYIRLSKMKMNQNDIKLKKKSKNQIKIKNHITKTKIIEKKYFIFFFYKIDFPEHSCVCLRTTVGAEQDTSNRRFV